MTDADSALLEELHDMWLTNDPPPAGLTESMIAVVAAAGLDQEWELLVLVSDSADGPVAQVRGLSTSRVLYFNAAAGWSLEAELDGDQVRGQLIDYDDEMTAIEVRAESRDGASSTATLDEVGYFSMQAQLGGSVRFAVRIGDHVATSHWLDV